MMIRAVLLSTALILSACGYDGTYRYPCMDPENWKKPECNPPICVVEGSCTKDLIGFDWRTNPENLPIEEFIEDDYEQDEE
jgi:hypothetical protein